ncbi:sodium/potassium/calcium exchanger 2-like isoform X2 [Tachysurus fulvidraco]|uniref:sodium/potassium/calcium exchanger 2-like isoform X2 n=1 Tax=Tachysurus fulvidraco TaxID=1234273 RepID=UPI001FEE3594|nr:sodium/potassium/calcium exchanger 2-like isoform X2 [Tachysurus fulvidraco]
MVTMVSANQPPRRHHVRRKFCASRILAFVLSLFAFSLLLCWSAFRGKDESRHHRTARSTHQEVDLTTQMTLVLENHGDYPEDFFSLEERRQGAVVLHIFGMLYMFIALAIVCDEFFVPALTVITDKLQISDDVAGATFMAAGGSAPELFTSVIGVFISHSNVGIGTIVGSAVFNILFVIGMCALFSREILNLTWWPLFRDVSFYIIDLIMLIFFFLDNYITYLESMALLGAYGSYVIFMKCNSFVESRIKNLLTQNQVHKVEAMPKADNAGGDGNQLSAKPHLQRGVSSASLHNSLMRNSIFQLMIHTLDPLSEGKFKDKASILHKLASKKGQDEMNGIVNKKFPKSTKVEVEVTPPMNGSIAQGEEEEEDEDQPLSLMWPETRQKQVMYLFIFPIVFPLWLTLPDVRRDVGETIGITEEIMGLTILAAGTSIPDLITSVIVARKGLGDMAVSSSVGSNIFDITVGLPFPWLLFSAFHNLQPVAVSSNGLFCAIVLLFLMLIFVTVSIAACKWKMSKLLGFFMFVLYFVFLVVSVMLEDKIITCPVSI